MPKKPPATKDTPPTQNSEPKKSFTVAPWAGENEGEKMIVYGGEGMGKTTLASMSPDPIFIGLDDGGRKIRHPKTGEPVKAVHGVETFEDLRDALHSPGLFDSGKTIVLDTITVAEKRAEPYLFRTIKVGDQYPTNIEQYGFGKGYKHLLDIMRVLLQDCETHVRAGRNILFLAQESAVRIANPEGLDYLQSGPALQHNNQVSIRNEVCQWVDHVFHINHLNTRVAGKPDDRTGKAVGDSTRAVYAAGARHFKAKSRTLSEDVISFETPDDDSLWQLLFGGE